MPCRSLAPQLNTMVGLHPLIVLQNTKNRQDDWPVKGLNPASPFSSTPYRQSVNNPTSTGAQKRPNTGHLFRPSFSLSAPVVAPAGNLSTTQSMHEMKQQMNKMQEQILALQRRSSQDPSRYFKPTGLPSDRSVDMKARAYSLEIIELKENCAQLKKKLMDSGSRHRMQLLAANIQTWELQSENIKLQTSIDKFNEELELLDIDPLLSLPSIGRVRVPRDDSNDSLQR
ncbi:hypothetical protein T440DRAFT_479461 [Plenodomus tracheiphilus IPT5]|uniref:Uncharacterized protein n=1 Tax=Plenodomus tracheiphilus IPT5 TaxID=1408161 RepID=A0A6A7B4E1_9PLEO|nr:hypothetical protein T440DRAFT_479461 [Plenodomus tracheiphilus IPT5]